MRGDDFPLRLHVSNRGLAAMDWMRQNHAAAWSAHAFEYTGHYPDPFPQRFRDAAAASEEASGIVGAPVPPTGSLPIPVVELWKPSNLVFAEISPGGNLLALVTTAPPTRGTVKEGPHKAGKQSRRERLADRMRESLPTLKLDHLLELIDLRSGSVIGTLQMPREFTRLDWADAQTLLVSIDAPYGQLDSLVVVRAVEQAGQPLRFESVVVPRPGLLVDPLPGTGHILFATEATAGRSWNLLVHRLDIRDTQALKQATFKLDDEVDPGINRDEQWFADGQGRLRAAIVERDDDRTVLLHGIGDTFEEVLDFAATEAFQPLALTAYGNRLVGTTDKDREQRDLVEFDPATRTVGRTLFSHPGVDVVSALFDANRNLVGAMTFESGMVVSHYFDAESARIDRSLRKAFPGRAVATITRDSAARNYMVMVSGSDAPGRLYHFDVATNVAQLVHDTRPWLDKRTFAPAHVVRAKAADDLDIESYLTLPARANGKAPLVVLAHGGPIGVRDSREFDPEVQFLASLGYAVLQVNFRGSEGFGRAFQEAGRRNYGTLIEDDIDAALAAALAAHPLDRDRMCMMGASYGGYSAMVSSIRWPGRFKCIVSLSGVSDRALFFTASDTGRSEEGRKALEEAIGDPRTQMDEMIRYSPLYHADKLVAPLLLAHGTEDFRVDYEHTRRLARVLAAAGRQPVVLTLEGEGHGIVDDAQRVRVYEAVAGFLRQHLGD